MLIDLKDVAVSRFLAFGPLEERDYLDLASLAGHTRWLKRGEHIYMEGDQPLLALLLRGWTASSITFEDGTRQVIKVQLPGDMLGVPNLALRTNADSVTALTDVQIGLMSPHALGRLFERNPRLGALLFLISQEERVRGMDRLASLGATQALSRVAALLRELLARLQRTDPAITDTIEIPLLQSDVASLIGITPVHLNRTIQRLRAERVLRWRRSVVTILDHARLAELGALPTREIAPEPAWLPRSPGADDPSSDDTGGT